MIGYLNRSLTINIPQKTTDFMVSLHRAKVSSTTRDVKSCCLRSPAEVQIGAPMYTT